MQTIEVRGFLLTREDLDAIRTIDPTDGVSEEQLGDRLDALKRRGLVEQRDGWGARGVWRSDVVYLTREAHTVLNELSSITKPVYPIITHKGKVYRR